MSAGILLLGPDEVIESRAARHKVALEIADTPALPFERTLITTPGTRVPWQLLPAAWGLLERWDAAVPFWEYTETAVNVGTAAERAATQTVVRDLRVLLHSVELLFVRRNEAGRALVEAWQAEPGERRLAFLRALYQVKPRLCVLPTSWLAAASVTRGRARPINAGRPLVRVEVEPGRFVKCHQGDEERVRLNFAIQKGRAL